MAQHTITGRRTVGEISIETTRCESALREVAVGAHVSYKELSSKVGRDVTRAARHVLQSARRRLLREHGIVFDAVIGEGLVRLDDSGVVTTASRSTDRIRRTARRELHRQATVNPERLPDPLKGLHKSAVIFHTTIIAVARPGALKKLEGMPALSKFSPADVLAAIEYKRVPLKEKK
jgi:hypothetical protein